MLVAEPNARARRGRGAEDHEWGSRLSLSTGVVTDNLSQMAGQVITGIGFLGGGIIFVRRESAPRASRQRASGWSPPSG
jgi:hypothetical protein